MRRVDFGCFGNLRFFLDQLEGVGVCEQGCKFFLEVVGLPGILVDVVLNGDLDKEHRTLYI